ncbi:hypothetical protein OEZ86_011517 [Tetradesmus obliquus]|uniref:Uncharacterized protein n=2 Tax=Tetradesmus obliquus TaxID=3088 RepID=A0ABY8TN89_TETOB|nr:hypothetical protein OEZ85_008345 [Tetradesmus obliquus]WIA29000.1 hypothetical protein OEZ86_011517 [Tetradesmus obliquus]|eukprot:jgi/Sobl393_1/228/SZX74967.1
MRLAAHGSKAEHSSTADEATRRQVTLAAAAALSGLVQQMLVAQEAEAIGGNPLDYKKELARKRRKIPLEEFSDGPQGLKFYDITVGDGAEAKVGERVAIHYDVKFRNITFMTSRQGIGVTGGNPLGFDVGQPAGSAGSTLPGIDLGVRGMRVGGQRRVLVPPELGYGSRGVGEIPPNATLQVDIELLSIKTSAFGYRTKLVEG